MATQEVQYGHRHAPTVHLMLASWKIPDRHKRAERINQAYGKKT